MSKEIEVKLIAYTTVEIPYEIEDEFDEMTSREQNKLLLELALEENFTAVELEDWWEV